MNTQIRVLIVEDSEDDALLVVRELEKGGYAVASQRVETPKEMAAALKKQTWDIILSDYRMPHFSGSDALKLLLNTLEDIPFIIVSGKIGEETAVELMLAGAADYVMKTNLKRLVPAVQRELREAEVRRERQRAEEQIVNQSKFPSEDPDPVMRVSREGVILFRNKAGLPLLLSWQSEIGKPLPPDWGRLVGEVYKTGISKTAEAKCEDKVYLLNVVPVIDNDYVNIYARDITDLKNAEVRVQHLNQILLTIRKINQLIVEIEDEDKLLQKVCQVLIDGRDYKLARIGFIKEGSYDIQPVAQAGFAQGYVDSLKVTWDDSEYGRSPAGMAIKTGKPVMIRDVTSDESYRLWRDLALHYGLSSIIALPLIVGNKVIGILVVYSESRDAFDTDEIELLKEMAGDISLGITSIRQRNEVRQAEKKYSTLVENSNDGIIIIQDALVKFSSPHMDKMTGFSIAENLNKPFIDFIAPHYRKSVIETYQKRQAGQEVPNRYEVEILTKDGGSVPVEVSSSIIEYEGKPATMAVVRDITERKQAERQIKESEARYHGIFDRAPVSIIVMDKDGTVLDANPYHLASFFKGKTKYEDFVGLNVLTDPATKDSGFAEQHRKLLNGESVDIKETYVPASSLGPPAWLNLRGVPLFEQGKVTGAIAIIEDITERKQAEEQLRLQAKLLDAQMDEVFVHDGDGNIMFVNIVASTITGYTKDELLKMNIRQLDTPEMAEQIPSRKMIVDKRGFNTFETIHRNKNGTLIPFEVHSIATEWQGQKIILSVDRDITVRKQMEEKLKQSYEQLQKNFGAITQTITSTVELRDPYTAGHQGRVAHLAQAIAREMNLAEEQANQIYTAGLIHDIGKISIPAEILSKAGKLNDIEFSLIKMHSQSGYDVLKNIEFPYPMAQWVLEHHERMNGSGYPYGLTGDKIGLEARIIAVADVVEAMSSHRPYRAALGIDAALAEIKKNKGILYDSAAVEACLRLFNEKGFKLE